MCSGAHSVLTFTLVGARFWDKNATWWNRRNSTGRFGVSLISKKRTKDKKYSAKFDGSFLGNYADLDEAAKAVDVEVRKSRSHGSKLSFPTEAEKQLLQQDLQLRSAEQQANYAALKQPFGKKKFAAALQQQKNEKKRLKEICVCEQEGRIPGRRSNNTQICRGRRKIF